MSSDANPCVTEVGPQDAWNLLSNDSASVLIDVRTRPEWDFVGGPDISALGRSVLRIEWMSYPGMSPNPAFTETLMTELGDTMPSRLLFICRSGARSMSAAVATAEALAAKGQQIECVNVAEGFEGDMDALKHRGGLNGWKARGLSWRQS